MDTRKILAPAAAVAALVLLAACTPARTTVAAPAATPHVRPAETIATSDLERRLAGAEWFRLTAATIEIGADGNGIPLAVVSLGNAKRAVHVLDVVFGKPDRSDYGTSSDDPCSPPGRRYAWTTPGGSSPQLELDDPFDDAADPSGYDFTIEILARTATSVGGTEILLSGPGGELVGSDVSYELAQLPADDRVTSQPGSAGQATVALVQQGWSGDELDHTANPFQPRELGVTVTVKGDAVEMITAPDTLHGSTNCPRADTQE